MSGGATMPTASVCVCICTYKRPELLLRALEGVRAQQVSTRLAVSVVVADNDCDQSARAVVSKFSAQAGFRVTYCVEPEQNIAMARNRALRNADADLVAFIDDDEFPAESWLARMLETLFKYEADGVLGPVRAHFDTPPPAWLLASGLSDRPEHATGFELQWRQTRTGNTLFRRQILEDVAEPFQKEFGNGGEDQDFFRRMIERGRRFVWCNEAIVYEVVPPERCERRYWWKRALLRGQNEKLHLTAASVCKSLVAVPLYLVILPFAFLAGQANFMRYSVRMLDHLGKLFAATGIQVIRGSYLTGESQLPSTAVAGRL
jgi:succinoglycan biosynthesis protein ExoM